MNALKAIFLSFLGVALSCSSIVIDDSANAAQSNDTSIVIEGCGNQPISGFTYCRKEEGPMEDRDVIAFHVPDSNCERESCVTLTVFGPEGPDRSLFIPKGWKYYALHWSQMTGKEEFSRRDRGFWTIVMDVYWRDNDGDQRRTSLLGEIRLRVLSSNYQSLHNARGEGPYAFKWNVEGPFRVGYTTAGRSSVWKP